VGKPVVGEIVVLPFPQTDLEAGKRRPALVVARLQGGDVILCQVTSQARSDGYPISLLAADFERGRLAVDSFIRRFRPAVRCAIDDSNIAVGRVMPQLIVRQIEDRVVKKLKERAGKHGVSMEEEHRRILREALLGSSKRKQSFKDYLRQMPDIGPDELFERDRDWGREVEL
jgi:plasmid stability protein